jgi:GT2 family glycosyltransferase
MAIASHIAVVIVTYKSARLTVNAIRSLESERTGSQEIRVIVVDNASGDSPEIAAAIEQNRWDSWVTLITAPRNGGFAYGNNLGIEFAYARGRPDFIFLLNPDTLVRPGAIEILIRFLEKHPKVGIAGGSFENPDGSHWPISFRFPTLMSELDAGLRMGLVSRLLNRWTVARAMRQENQPTDWICGAAMMIRPAVLASIGGFDENYFLYYEETDFCFRARQAGFDTWYVPASRVMHIMGQSTSVTDPARGVRRLPGYWFESRRRYFVVTHGIWQAALIDVVAVLAHVVGNAKSIMLRREIIPNYIRDLFHHSVIWSRNRQVSEPRCFFPAV